MKRDDLAIKRLLLNDQFLEYVCRHSESLDDLHQQDEINSLASREDLLAASEIIMSQNHDVAILSAQESEDLKKAILASVLSP